MFAETDNDIVSYTESTGKFSIEFPDGWSVVETRDKNYTPEKVVEAGAIIKDADGETVVRINVWSWFKLDEPLKKPWTSNDLPYPEDYTDEDMRNVISGRNAWYCSFEVYDDPAQSWAGCYKFDVVDEETTFTNEGRKLHMVEMEYILQYGKYHSIDTEIWDSENVYEISARTTVKDSKQSHKFDTKNLQKIRDVIKSLVILEPNIELELEPEPELEPKPESEPEPELQTSIPDWIKNNAGWWANGQIDDTSFLQGISYLIQNNIIVVSPTDAGSESSGTIPDWVKNNAGWWATDRIGDEAFVNAIQYLIQKGMIQV